MAYYSKKNERDGISIVKLAFFSSFSFHVTVSLFPSLLDLSFTENGHHAFISLFRFTVTNHSKCVEI